MDKKYKRKWILTNSRVRKGNSLYGIVANNYPIIGYPIASGLEFSGILKTPGRDASYTFTLINTNGTSDTSDDITYTYDAGTKKIKRGAAIILPSLSSGKWTNAGVKFSVSESQTVKFAPGNL